MLRGGTPVVLLLSVLATRLTLRHRHPSPHWIMLDHYGRYNWPDQRRRASQCWSACLRP
jgi:hypothetical protein